MKGKGLKLLGGEVGKDETVGVGDILGVCVGF